MLRQWGTGEDRGGAEAVGDRTDKLRNKRANRRLRKSGLRDHEDVLLLSGWPTQLQTDEC